MAGIEVIDMRIKRKEAEVASLEKKLEAAKVYLQALQDIRQAMAAENEGGGGAETSLRTGSAVARAREVILQAGKPLHIDDLLAKLGRANTRDSKASLQGSLSAYVRRGEIFSRPAPSTFGLIELGHRDGGTDYDEPPQDFGRVQGEQKPRTYSGGLDDEIPF